jgi:hypothetical protein
MYRVVGYVLLGLAAISLLPASIYSLRHPHYRGEPWKRPQLAARRVRTAATFTVIVVAIVAMTMSRRH